MSDVQTFEKPLIELLKSQSRTEDEVGFVQKAYDFAHKAHDGQLRKSEDPYIIHPTEVAMILAELDADVQTPSLSVVIDIYAWRKSSRTPDLFTWVWNVLPL